MGELNTIDKEYEYRTTEINLVKRLQNVVAIRNIYY